jgi:hypothetical protein
MLFLTEEFAPCNLRNWGLGNCNWDLGIRGKEELGIGNWDLGKELTSGRKPQIKKMKKV